MHYIEFIKNLQKQLVGTLVLTGSRVLQINGLVDKTDESDIDLILINATKDDKALLKRLSELSPIYDFAKYRIDSGKWEVKYQFKLTDFKVDIFIEDCNIIFVDYPQYQGVYINPVINIVNAKKRMNRKKDWLKLLEISQIFINFTELKQSLISK